MAAGLTVQRNVPAAMDRIAVLLDKPQVAGALGVRFAIDALLMPGAATVELIEKIAGAGPFGGRCPRPAIRVSRLPRFPFRKTVSHRATLR